MKKQRICIVGEGLSGLMTVIALNNLPNLEVHLIAKKNKHTQDKRATAISASNFSFFQDIMSKLDKKLFWPSKKISLFYETNNQKINFLNFNENKNNLMYVFENNRVKEILFKEIKRKKIKIIKKNITKLSELDSYDLKVLCLGRNSKIYKDIINTRSIDKDYKEMALTGYVKHNLKDVTTSQFFLKEGPLAILPFSRNNFSFVWSVKKEFIKKNIKSIIATKISEVLKVNKKINITGIQSYPLTLNLKRTYYKNNALILGEGLHTIHPLAGQGFNLVIRDIKKLKEVLKYYSGLGISIKSSSALEDFSSHRKSANIITGLGIDLTYNFFKQNTLLEPFKEVILKNVSKNNTLKKISKFISNQGLSI
ncbi:FAD-dependent monooxygenase [Pelagibacteraceae bacterium]|jgi:2-polyprenyl-6-methoxyphenol hydroxylase-like FAD-dependent oxidoreductase|nr:FAD-dependent monooxygenase [Pelagibacteraceae bacterium]